MSEFRVLMDAGDGRGWKFLTELGEGSTDQSLARTYADDADGRARVKKVAKILSRNHKVYVVDSHGKKVKL